MFSTHVINEETVCDVFDTRCKLRGSKWCLRDTFQIRRQ